MSENNKEYTIVKSAYRSNGLECPPNIFQLLITIDLLYSTTLYLLSIFYNTITVFEYIILTVSLPCLSATVYYWYKASKSDPTDPVVKSNRLAVLNNLAFDSSRYESMCTICNSSVGNDVKHCGTCNRCVESFDHHCIWLNNCVGKSNYSLFIKLLASLLLYEASLLVFSFVKIAEWFKGELQDSKGINFLGASIFLLVQAVALELFVVNLLVLHAWLRSQGMTTYQFIKMRNKKRKRAKNLSQTELANSNMSIPNSPKRSEERLEA